MAAAPPGPRRRLTSTLAKRFFAPRYGSEEVLSLLTQDGVRLGGARLAGPPDALATFVVVHGFSHSSRTPGVHAFARSLARRAHVIVPDLRGHGASQGLCTLGESEVLDVAAAVAAAPPGPPVVTVGISLGGAAALLHAGTHGLTTPGFAGVVAVSAPAWWGAWDTAATARIRRYATSAAGRAFMARVLNTRLAARCVGVPDSHEVVASIAPRFTVVVHDPADHYFGEEHAQTLYRWAREPRELWLLSGTGHGTDLLTPALADRLLAYVGRDRPPLAPGGMEDGSGDG